MSIGLRRKLVSYKKSLILILFILALSVSIAEPVLAAGGLYNSTGEATSGAPHSLRRDEDYGENTELKLRIYTGVIAPNAVPSNGTGPTLSINESECKNSRNGNSVSITNVSRWGSQCRIMPTGLVVNGGSWTYDNSTARAYKDVIFTLNADDNQEGDGYVFEFRVNITNFNGYGAGYYISYPANNNPRGWAVNDRNDEPTYNIDFAPNPCQIPSGPQYVGMYDPERSLTIRLFDGDRTSSAPASRLIATRTASGGDSGEQKVFSIAFNPDVNKKYRLQVRATKENDTMSLFWPYDTVYAVTPRCPWRVNVSSTPTTSSGGSTVVVDPEEGTSGWVRWTHTASNPTLTNITPSDDVDLTYGGTAGTPLIGTQNNASIPANSSNSRTTGPFTVPATTPPGTQYCQTLTSSRRSSADSRDITSTACVTVQWPARTPYFRVEGGDIHTRSGSIQGIRGGGTGTGGQLAALAAATINGFPTGSNNYANNSNRLTFTNTPSLGNFSSGYPPISSMTVSGSGTKHVNNPAIVPNNTVISSGYIGNPSIQTTGDIHIWGDIIAADQFDLMQTPMAKIIAGGNIYISHEVKRIDAILMAKGTIYTCARTGGANLTVPSSGDIADFNQTRCRKHQLTINGAVSAGAIKLLRTNGSIQRGTGPAEIFNYPPTAWLQALTNTGGSAAAAKYDAYSSLPPIL